jgi:hypothetical protein
VLEEDGIITIDGSSWDPHVSHIWIEHRGLATIRTEDDYIPNLDIDPPVSQLLFEAGGDHTCDVIHSAECRRGPILIAHVSSDATVSQKDFLSASTLFLGNDKFKLSFQYLGESAVNYTFNHTIVEFYADDVVSFVGLTLWNSPVSQSADNKLHLKVQNLVADVLSLPNSSFISFEVNDTCLIRDNEVTKINLTDTSVQVSAGASWTPYMRQQNDALFIVETNASHIILGVNKQASKSVLSKFQLRCMTGATVELEVSFYEVLNPFDIEIMVMYGNAITLKTDLMNLPLVTISSEWGEVKQTRVIKQPIFTAELAFEVFIGFTALMAVISVVLCIVGHYCMPPEEEFDVSSDEEEEGKSKTD